MHRQIKKFDFKDIDVTSKLFIEDYSLISVSSENFQDTLVISGLLASLLTGGDIVCLDGDLGAGKTVFASGIAKALGIDEVIPSPTFTILHEHFIPSDKCKDEVTNNFPIRVMNHFDVYRLEGSEDFYSLGFDEYLDNPYGVCVIEWASKIQEVFSRNVIQVLLFRPDIQSDVEGLSENRDIYIAFNREDKRAAGFFMLLEKAAINCFFTFGRKEKFNDL